MFEDDPPPFPSAASIEIPSDSTFADLSDHNRFTAVADDDYDGNNTEFCSHISAVLQNESDSEFVSAEAAALRNECTGISKTPDCAKNLVEILPYSDFHGQHNRSSFSLQSRSSQLAQISNFQNSSPKILSRREDSDVVESSIMAYSQVNSLVISILIILRNISFKYLHLMLVYSLGRWNYLR